MSYQRRKAYEAAKDMLEEGCCFVGGKVAYCLGVNAEDYDDWREFYADAWKALLDVLKEDSE